MNNQISRIEPASINPSKRIDETQLRRVCLEFESIFIQTMMKAMRNTIPQTTFFGKQWGKEIFESLFDAEICKMVSQKGGLGLGKILYEQMIQKLENQNTYFSKGS